MSSSKQIPDALRNECAKRLLEASTIAGSNNTLQDIVKEDDYDSIYILTKYDNRGKLWFIVHDPRIMPNASDGWVALPANNIKEVLLNSPMMFGTNEAAESYIVIHKFLDL